MKNLGVAVALGAAIGTALGVSFKNIPAGTGIGIAVSVLFYLINKRRMK